MTVNHATTVGLPIPSEAVAFGAQQGFDKFLPAVLEMTRRVFPAAQQLQVVVAEDPEFMDRYLVLEVHASLTVDQAIEANHRWHSELFQCCPPTHIGYFRLGMRLGG